KQQAGQLRVIAVEPGMGREMEEADAPERPAEKALPARRGAGRDDPPSAWHEPPDRLGLAQGRRQAAPGRARRRTGEDPELQLRLRPRSGGSRAAPPPRGAPRPRPAPPAPRRRLAREARKKARGIDRHPERSRA